MLTSRCRSRPDTQSLSGHHSEERSTQLFPGSYSIVEREEEKRERKREREREKKGIEKADEEEVEV